MHSNTHTGTTGINENIESIEVQLSLAREQLAKLQTQVARAKTFGTGDHDEAAKRATEQAREPTLAEAIEKVLRGDVMTLDQLARAVGETISRTAAALRPLRKSLGNLGTPALARWTWRIGDQASTEELTALVRRLIMDQPLTTAELVAATGARASRVGGALVAIQRSGARVLNLGTETRYRWFVVPEHATDARLEPKARAA